MPMLTLLRKSSVLTFFVFLLLAALSLLSCSQPTPSVNKDETVQLSGVVLDYDENSSVQTIGLRYESPVPGAGKEYWIPVEKNGRFRYAFPVFGMHDIRLTIGDRQFPLLVTPGQRLELAFEAADPLSTMQVKRDTEACNALLLEYLRARRQEWPEKYKYETTHSSDFFYQEWRQNMEPAAFAEKVNAQREAELKFLETFLVTREAVPDFERWARHEIQYETAAAVIKKMIFPFEAGLGQMNFTSRKEIDLELLDGLPPDKPAAMPSRAYRAEFVALYNLARLMQTGYTVQPSFGEMIDWINEQNDLEAEDRAVAAKMRETPGHEWTQEMFQQLQQWLTASGRSRTEMVHEIQSAKLKQYLPKTPRSLSKDLFLLQLLFSKDQSWNGPADTYLPAEFDNPVYRKIAEKKIRQAENEGKQQQTALDSQNREETGPALIRTLMQDRYASYMLYLWDGNRPLSNHVESIKQVLAQPWAENVTLVTIGVGVSERQWRKTALRFGTEALHYRLEAGLLEAFKQALRQSDQAPHDFSYQQLPIVALLRPDLKTLTTAVRINHVHFPLEVQKFFYEGNTRLELPFKKVLALSPDVMESEVLTLPGKLSPYGITWNWQDYTYRGGRLVRLKARGATKEGEVLFFTLPDFEDLSFFVPNSSPYVQTFPSQEWAGHFHLQYYRLRPDGTAVSGFVYALPPEEKQRRTVSGDAVRFATVHPSVKVQEESGLSAGINSPHGTLTPRSTLKDLQRLVDRFAERGFAVKIDSAGYTADDRLVHLSGSITGPDGEVLPLRTERFERLDCLVHSLQLDIGEFAMPQVDIHRPGEKLEIRPPAFHRLMYRDGR